MPGRLELLLPQGQWRKLAVNIASLFSVQVANYLLPLLTVPYVSRIVGPEKIGLVSFSQAYMFFFILIINYGFDMPAIRRIAANSDNQHVINETFSKVLICKLLFWVLSTIAFFSITYSVPQLRAESTLHLYAFFSSIGSAILPFWFFQAMNDLKRVAAFGLAVKVLFTVAIFVLVTEPADYVYQNLSISIAHNLVSVAALYIAFKRYKIKVIIPSVRDLIDTLKSGWVFFLTGVVTVVYTNANSVVLGFLVNAHDVGIFSSGTRIYYIFQAFITLAFSQALFPLVAKKFGESAENGIDIIKKVLPISIAVSGLVALLIFLFSPILVNILFGAQFIQAVIVLRIVAFLPLLSCLNNLIGYQVLLNLGKERPYLYITASSCLIGLLLIFYLVSVVGYVGAAISWVLTELCISLCLITYLKHNGINIISEIKWRYSISIISGKLNELSASFNRQ